MPPLCVFKNLGDNFLFLRVVRADDPGILADDKPLRKALAQRGGLDKQDITPGGGWKASSSEDTSLSFRENKFSISWVGWMNIFA